MSEFNVGDKVYFESTIRAVENNDTYLVADRNGSRRFVAEDLTKVNESYNKGLNDAWELVKKIYFPSSDNRYINKELMDVFGCTDILKLSPQEALAKVKAYEECNKIKRGDVVRLKGLSWEAIVTRAIETNICCLFKDGSCASGCYKENYEKTGKHFDSIDEFMRQED